jgi:hypothetical protein
MKKFIALLLPLCFLGACGGDGAGPPCDPYIPTPTAPGTPVPGTSSQTVYHATFPNGSLECGILDRIHATTWPMKQGNGEVSGQTHALSVSEGGNVALELTAPDPVPAGQTPSIGVFSTGLNFGTGAILTVRATFHKPEGTRLPPASDDETNRWAVGVAVRTGDERDLGAHTRLGVTFQVRANGAVLNVLETDPAGTHVNRLAQVPVPQEIVDKIFGIPGADPEPFTLQLFVDRQTGKGSASLIPSWPPVQAPFEMRNFKADRGPMITTAGAALANCCAWGDRVSVEVSDFEIVQAFRKERPAPVVPNKEPNIPNPPPIDPLAGR